MLDALPPPRQCGPSELSEVDQGPPRDKIQIQGPNARGRRAPTFTILPARFPSPKSNPSRIASVRCRFSVEVRSLFPRSAPGALRFEHLAPRAKKRCGDSLIANLDGGNDGILNHLLYSGRRAGQSLLDSLTCPVISGPAET